MVRSRRLLVALLVTLASWPASARGVEEAPLATDAVERALCEGRLKGRIWARTELYFGLSRANGPDVTEEEFQAFLDVVVTPRFPDGLTLLSGDGQFRGASGVVVQERSKLLVLFYPWSEGRNRRVEQIRSIYKREFQQEAVLRADATSCVSF